MSKSEGLLRVCIAYVVALFLGGASLYLLDYGPLLDVLIADLAASLSRQQRRGDAIALVTSGAVGLGCVAGNGPEAQ